MGRLAHWPVLPRPRLAGFQVSTEGYQCELTAVDPKTVKIGDRVEMTFRRPITAGGVQNYFCKARPIRK